MTHDANFWFQVLLIWISILLLDEDQETKTQVADSELPLIPRQLIPELTSISSLDEDVDVDKLPRASANKKRKGAKSMEDMPQLWNVFSA